MPKDLRMKLRAFFLRSQAYRLLGIGSTPGTAINALYEKRSQLHARVR
jgi:hypothetical protein